MSPSNKRGLGRGLASLIPDSAFGADEDSVDRSLRMVPLDEVRPNPEQPREAFDSHDLKTLADSIRAHGVLSPLVVRKEAGHYVLIAGERRLRAAGLAGLHEVPVVVRQASEPALQLELALIENLQRSDLDPIEAARGYQRLVEEFGLTQEAVGKRVGKGRATIANAVRLLMLPDYVLSAIREDRISAGHGRAMLSVVDDEVKLREVLARTVAQDLNVRDVEALVARLGREREEGRSNESMRQERSMEYATRILRDALRTSVTIRPLKKGGGRIVVDYADAEDLERLIHAMQTTSQG
ncbi:MAG: ParB family chromosome partitioning protein [Kiritimatiellia bacterium]|jgi:ParB family chromosome partitioning protein